APLPGWAKVLIGLGVAVLALMLLGILAAIAIPVFLNGRNQAADVSVKADLKTVASAEAAYFTKFGTYTRDPTQLGIAEPKNDIGILTADANGFCLGGRVADTQGRDWYYSPAGGVTRTPCA
ncbi:MAG: type IV pilin protein, partial [Janthinobacterium lividum]